MKHKYQMIINMTESIFEKGSIKAKCSIMVLKSSIMFFVQFNTLKRAIFLSVWTNGIKTLSITLHHHNHRPVIDFLQASNSDQWWISKGHYIHLHGR